VVEPGAGFLQQLKRVLDIGDTGITAAYKSACAERDPAHVCRAKRVGELHFLFS